MSFRLAFASSILFFTGCDGYQDVTDNQESTELENASGDLPDREDLEAVAELIATDALGDEDFESYAFSEQEMRDLAVEVGLASGGDYREMRSFADSLNFSRGGSSEMAPPPAACTQTVEKANESGDTYATSYASSTTCDGDSSDVDWVFNFYPTWADSADDIRWDANTYVRTVFAAAYGSNLLGSSLCTSPVQLCIGTTGVTAAGGATYVKSKLFISHK